MRAGHVRMRVSELFRRYEGQLAVAGRRRVIVSLVVVAACGIVPLVSLWQVARAAASDVAPVVSTQSVVALKTPLASVRRAADSVRIESQLSAMRTGARRLHDELPDASCLVIRSSGRDVAAYGATTPLIPGSNMKLLVAAVALDVLGTQHRYTTTVRGTAAGRAVVGNLWLVGSGDPHLVTRSTAIAPRYPVVAPTYLDTIVDELVAQGITTVTGSIVGDGSLYDDERFAPGWGDGIRGVEAGPLSALVVDDGLVVGSLVRRSDPALAGAETLTTLLRERGITVLGTPRTGTPGSDVPVIASVTSAPLVQSVANVLRNSDNNSAELLLKEVGLVSRSDASRLGGLRTVLDIVTTWGVPVDGIALADGSGLDRANQLTCNFVVSLLEREADNESFVNAMAVAGRTGTLQDVFRTPPARDSIRAKTGTLSGVKALSGYSSRRGLDTEFAFIVNDRRASVQAEWLGWWNRLSATLVRATGDVNIEVLLPQS